MVTLWLMGCVFYTDADRDRDGDGERSVAFGGADCDDADPAVSPGAAEVCNGKDDDCDGRVDVGVTDGVPAFLDGDGDGYGVTAVTACELSAGVVGDDGDCDDADAAVNPGAVEDVCTEADEDCDGSGGASAPVYRFGGEPGGVSGLGAALATGDQAGAGTLLIAGAADAGQVLAFRVADGSANSSERWARIEGGGDSVAMGDAFVGDAEADDLLVGDAVWSGERGRFGIFQLAESGGDHSWSAATVWWEGEINGDHLGAVSLLVATGGSANLALVGAPGADGGKGRAYQLVLPANGVGAQAVPIADDAYGVVSSQLLPAGTGLGSAFAAWSDPGGTLQVAYGLPGDTGDHGAQGGQIVIAPLGSFDPAASSTARIRGVGSGDAFGSTLATGDYDGDGEDDLVVAAPRLDADETDPGAVYLFPGAALDALLSATVQEGVADDALLRVYGPAGDTRLGRALTFADGALLLGGDASGCVGQPGAGAVWQVPPGLTGSVVLSDAERLLTGEPDAQAGTALLPGLDGGFWVGELGSSRVSGYGM